MFAFYDFGCDMVMEFVDLRSCLAAMWALGISGKVMRKDQNGAVEDLGYYNYNDTFSESDFKEYKLELDTFHHS